MYVSVSVWGFGGDVEIGSRVTQARLGFPTLLYPPPKYHDYRLGHYAWLDTIFFILTSNLQFSGDTERYYPASARLLHSRRDRAILRF